VIKFKGITKIYGNDFVALDDVNLEIKKGEFVSLVGQSGAGKSTLVKLLIREEAPTRGTVYVFGKNVGNLNSKELPVLRRRIGIVFQDIKLLPDKTVSENISYAMEASGASDKDISENVPELLKIVGLLSRTDSFPKELSGGESQRIALARALAHEPDILIADEPTGNLDLLNTWDIVRLLLKINEFGTTVILATHNKDIVDNIKRRVITMDRGRVIRDQEKGNYVL
jgi:cell division transport system ATP-binding protein